MRSPERLESAASELCHLKEGFLTNQSLTSPHPKMGNIKICPVLGYARLVSVTHGVIPTQGKHTLSQPKPVPKPDHLSMNATQECQLEVGIFWSI